MVMTVVLDIISGSDGIYATSARMRIPHHTPLPINGQCGPDVTDRREAGELFRCSSAEQHGVVTL